MTQSTQQPETTKTAQLPSPPSKVAIVSIEPWDPLARVDEDPGLYAAAQKREIRNILKSYTGYFDLFSEMLQNSLDAVEKRVSEGIADYKPTGAEVVEAS